MSDTSDTKPRPGPPPEPQWDPPRAPYGTDRPPFTDLPAAAHEQRAEPPAVPAPRGGRPIPPRVLQTWPLVDPASWEWVSPRRLRGRHAITPSRLVLVAVEGPRAERALGSVVSDGVDDGPVYAELMVSLAASYGRQAACADGVAPLGRDGLCMWCGRGPAVHRAPPLPGPAPAATAAEAPAAGEPAGWFE